MTLTPLPTAPATTGAPVPLGAATATRTAGPTAGPTGEGAFSVLVALALAGLDPTVPRADPADEPGPSPEADPEPTDLGLLATGPVSVATDLRLGAPILHLAATGHPVAPADATAGVASPPPADGDPAVPATAPGSTAQSATGTPAPGTLTAGPPAAGPPAAAAPAVSAPTAGTPLMDPPAAGAAASTPPVPGAPAAGGPVVESADRPASTTPHVSSAQQAATPVPTPAAEPTAHVPRQVFPEVTRLFTAGNGTHRVTLQLAPESLGEVKVTLVVRNGAVQVTLAAGDQARATLLGDAPELHRLLELTGATETRIVVRDLTAAAGTATAPGAGQPGAQQHGAEQHGSDQDGSHPEGRTGDGRAHTDDQHARTRGGPSARDGDQPGATASGTSPLDTSTRSSGVDVSI